MALRKSEQDAFVKGLKERLPAELRESFTNQQLDALRIAFGARRWGKHPVDLRGTLDLLGWRYYYVLLIGRNRRNLTRRERAMSRLATALVIFAFLLFSGMVGLLMLYLAKSAMGIDLLPNFSLGVWDWFNR
ncbi:3-phosphoshikimate 1-carboxyvinyltransferase [Pseudomonas sp.]|uniref:3-phosphoshikimate 1-carboxyvinyltransferase n=1 Tax=Pseudomonas sp. TaxID=306 RepID=UPI00272B2346|nr:3-phosphoshikimate 1-carboxyvinyltransferase [Pseudomonas sp.]